MPNTYSPTPQNTSYSSGPVNVPQSYGFSNGISSSDLIGTIAIAPSLPIVSISFDGSLDIKLTFNSSENGQNIKLQFAPEQSMSVNELMLIMMLSQLALSGNLRFQADVMSYVRKNNLERHFKISIV